MGGAACALTATCALATDISGETTTPVSTSTISGGGPGDLRITSTGKITLATSPGVSAVTLDSPNSVNNEGEIKITDSDGARGIRIVGGGSGGVRNAGSIILDETYERPDADDNDEPEGPYAIGFDRVGILLDAGGPFAGDIVIAAGGSVSVAGNQSAAIRLQSLLGGALVNDGSLTVIGDNAVGIDIRAGVDGDVLQSGGVAARGLDAVGISVRGDIGGGIANEGSLTASGFASITRTNYVDPDTLGDNDTPIADRIHPDNLLVGGPALAIGGSVAEGLLNNGAIGGRDEDDEVKDAPEDFDENRTTGFITSYGSAPAVLISADWDSAASGDIVIGKVVEKVRDTRDDDDDDDTDEIIATFDYDYGIVNRGQIFGNGLNVGFNAMGLRIEGSADGARSAIIEGGVYNAGTIAASGFIADATAVSLGRGAVVGRIDNVGAITATVQTSNAGTESATAILIEAGAQLEGIVNHGTIGAAVRGYSARATAIRDLSGGLESIENTGVISARFIETTKQKTGLGSTVAIDLSVHGSSTPVTILQRQGSGDNAPAIVGDILLGAGDDVVDIRAGRIEGDIHFGAGSDRLLLSDATFNGVANFGTGGGGLLRLSDGAAFTGAVIDTTQTLALEVVDSALTLTSSAPLRIGALAVTGDSTLAFSADLSSDLSAPRITAHNSAIIGAGSDLQVRITGFNNQASTFTLIESASLVVADGVAADISLAAPAIFKGALEMETTRLNVSLDIKTAGDLGLNRNETAAYASFLQVAASSAAVGDALTAYFDEAELVGAYRSLMPAGHDAPARFLSGETALAAGPLTRRLDQRGRSGGFWVQEHATYLRHQQGLETNGHHGYGLHVQAGYDGPVTDNLYVGLAGSFMTGKHKTTAASVEAAAGAGKETEATAFMIQPYASLRVGRAWLDVAGAAGLVDLYGSRRTAFGDVLDVLEYETSGRVFAASARAGYEARRGRLFAAPQIVLDHFALKRDAYEEMTTLSSNPLALSVDGGTAVRTSASALLSFGRNDDGAPAPEERPAFGYGYGGFGYGDALSRFQHLYVGYRLELQSSPYETTARFIGGGDDFILAHGDGYDNALLVGAGIGFGNDSFALLFSYDGEFAGDVMQHRAGASFTVRF